MRTTICLALVALCAAAMPAQVGTIIVPASNLVSANQQRTHAHTNVLAFRAAGANGALPEGETPASLACAYRLVKPVTPGCPIATTTVNMTKGARAIAIVDAYDNPNAVADLEVFSTQFGLPPGNLQVVYQNGVVPPVDATGGWELEEALDVQAAHAMAPNAQIYLVEAQSNLLTDLFAAEQLAANLVAAAGGGQVSNSWSASEFSTESTYDSTFVTPTVTFFASTGDSTFALGYPAVSPNVIAAGGTSLTRNSAGNLIGERFWSNQYGGGGGGISKYESIPSYQNGIAKIVGTKRGVPDVAFDADPLTGMAVYDSYPYMGVVYNWIQVGGSSLSSPALAGVINSAGHFLSSSSAELTKLYTEYANAVQYKQAFRDISKGNSKCTGGWDICTGIGTVLTLTGK